MTEIFIMVSVAIVLFCASRLIKSFICFKDSEEFKLLEEEFDEEEIDEKEFNFLLIGVLATVLFLVFGLFTGELIYYFLVLFIITAVIFMSYLSSNNKF